MQDQSAPLLPPESTEVSSTPLPSELYFLPMKNGDTGLLCLDTNSLDPSLRWNVSREKYNFFFNDLSQFFKEKIFNFR